MRVRAKKKAPAHKMQGGQAAPRVPALPYSFPAPINGWVLSENAATPMAASAKVLDNWIPTTSGVELRGGNILHATLDAAVVHLTTYRSGSNEILFGCTAAGIFDIASPADAEVTPTASVTGQTSGNYSSTMFTTSGGEFMYMVNGADDAQLFDGSTFTTINAASSPSFTNVGTDALSYVWAFANRLFFVEEGTDRFWYLPVASIAGAATSFALGGVFRKGGSLLFGATWSSDSGDGLDDRCVFVSTEGEVAIYQGTNPASAADWALVGVYEIPRPLGKNAHIRAGGDLLIATTAGVIPITSAIQQDIAAVSGAAISKPIAPEWQRQASLLTSPWEMEKVVEQNLLIVSQPGDVSETCLIANLQTGAWARWTGLDVRCLGSFDENAYYGDAAGLVYRMNAAGSDNGTPFTARYLGQFDQMGAQGITKTARQARATFEAGTPFVAQLVFKSDFDVTPSSPPSSAADFTLDVWDVGLWDVAIWDAQGTLSTTSDWRAVGATGTYLAPELQITSGTGPKPTVRLVSIDCMAHVGEAVT